MGVRRSGGQPPPPLPLLQRTNPKPGQSNRQAAAVSRFAEDSAVSTPSLGRECRSWIELVRLDQAAQLLPPAVAEQGGLPRTDHWCRGHSEGRRHRPQASVTGPELQWPPDGALGVTEGDSGFQLLAQRPIPEASPVAAGDAAVQFPELPEGPLAQLTGLALLDHREVAVGDHQLGFSDRLGPGESRVLAPAVAAPPIQQHSPKGQPASDLLGQQLGIGRDCLGLDSWRSHGACCGWQCTSYCHAAQAQLAGTDTRKPESGAYGQEISKHPHAGAQEKCALGLKDALRFGNRGTAPVEAG